MPADATIHVRRIGPDDAALLARLQTRTFEEAYAGVHSAEDIGTYCRTHYTRALAEAELAAPATECCVAELDAEPAGYYLVKHDPCPLPVDGLAAELKQIYVLRSAYGSGLGRALYNHAIESLRLCGIDTLWLCVSDLNERAQAFYAKLGFARLGDGPALIVGSDTLRSSILARRT